MTLYTHIKAVNRIAQAAAVIGLGLLIAGSAHAAGSGMRQRALAEQIKIASATFSVDCP